MEITIVWKLSLGRCQEIGIVNSTHIVTSSFLYCDEWQRKYSLISTSHYRGMNKQVFNLSCSNIICVVVFHGIGTRFGGAPSVFQYPFGHIFHYSVSYVIVELSANELGALENPWRACYFEYTGEPHFVGGVWLVIMSTITARPMGEWPHGPQLHHYPIRYHTKAHSRQLFWWYWDE